MNTQSYVSWNYTGSDHSGFRLERSSDSGSNWSIILTCTNTTTSFYDNDVWWGSSSWYRVSATNDFGAGPTSSLAMVFIAPPAFDLPTILASQSGSMFASASYLQWTYTGSSQGSTVRFDLERSDDSGSLWTVTQVSSTGSNYVQTASWGQGYWYRIRAFADFGLYSEYSATASVYIVFPPVPAPDFISALQFPTQHQSSSVSWSFTGSTDLATGFVLQRAELRGPSEAWSSYEHIYTASNISTKDYWDTSLTYSKDYAYQVFAYSGSDFRRSTVAGVGLSFMTPPQPRIWAWQHGTTTQSVVFWNSECRYTMSLSRSSDGGTTWDWGVEIAPMTWDGLAGYYYIDDPVVVGNTYTYKVQEIFYPASEPSSSNVSVTIVPETASRTVLAVTADAGFQYNDPTNTVWELHTASLLEANVVARRDFQALGWLLGGDNGYESNTFRGGYEGVAGRLLGPSSSFWTCVGNHDVSDMGLANYRNYFHMFTQSVGSRDFYTASWGPVTLFSLREVSSGGTQLSESSIQWNWFSSSIEDSLNNHPETMWRIVMVHIPVIVSSGSHEPNPDEAAIPWQSWGIDAVFAGHVHWVERIESSSVVFINTSLMGSDKRTITTASLETKWWYTGEADSDYIWTLLEVNSGSNYHVLSMSFYSGSTKVDDTGSTGIANAMKAGYSTVLMKPWYAPPTASAIQGGEFTASVSWIFSGNFSQSLFRSIDSGSTWPLTYSIDPLVYNYEDMTVAADTSYWYKVRHLKWPTEPYSNVAEVFISS